jgi:hypothetical protein
MFEHKRCQRRLLLGARLRDRREFSEARDVRPDSRLAAVSPLTSLWKLLRCPPRSFPARAARRLRAGLFRRAANLIVIGEGMR